MEIPCVEWKGKSVSPIYIAFSREVKKFLNPKLQCISTTNRRMSMPLSFFMWSMNGQTRVISEVKKREASSRNLHIVKNVDESLNISSYRIFPVFDRFSLLTLAWSLADKKLGRKLKQSLELIVFAGVFSVTELILQSHVMFTLHLAAVNKSQGIMIVQVALALFKRNNRLWPVNFENSKLWNCKEEFCALHASANRLWKCLLSQAFCGLVETSETISDTKVVFNVEFSSF